METREADTPNSACTYDWSSAAAAIFEQSCEPTLLIDRQLVVGAANRAFAALVGQSADRLVGRFCLDILSDGDTGGLVPIEGRHSPLARLMLAGHAVNHWPATVETPNGRCSLTVSFSPLKPSDQPLPCGLLTARPWSAIKPLERLPADLFAALSHDLRTPLTSIKGCASLLLLGRDSLDEGRVHQLLRIIDEQADRMREQIDNLADLSKIESGMLRVRRQPVPLGAVLEKVVTAAFGRGHALAIGVAGDGLPAVDVDARKIEQALLSLIDVLAAGSPAGSIITLDAESTQGAVTLSLEGPGMLAVRPEDTIGDEHGGQRQRVGLQLRLARGIALAHSGQLSIAGKPDGGTVARFTLPVAAQRTLPAPIVTSIPPDDETSPSMFTLLS